MSLVQQTIWLEKQNILREKGNFATPNPKLVHPIAPKTVDLVRGFYESDDVSRIMPGKIVSVNSTARTYP